jgi:hypothetical protein
MAVSGANRQTLLSAMDVVIVGFGRGGTMKILCMTKRWAHHTDSGGYDRLARESGAIEVRRPRCRGLAMRSLRSAWRGLHRENHYLLDYRFEDAVAEVKTFAKAWLVRPNLIHALYGDEHLNLLLSVRSCLPCPLVATFHLRLSEWRIALRRASVTNFGGSMGRSSFRRRSCRRFGLGLGTRTWSTFPTESTRGLFGRRLLAHRMNASACYALALTCGTFP